VYHIFSGYVNNEQKFCQVKMKVSGFHAATSIDDKGCKKKLSNTLSLTLPPQGGGDYKVTLWQDHRESTFIDSYFSICKKIDCFPPRRIRQGRTLRSQ
jgi:hypothetical protein